MVTFPTSPQPTLDGFISWVYQIGGVPVQYLPGDSVYLTYAYNTAVAIVNPIFQQVPGPIYLQMVYNLAMDRLVNWCPDVPNLVYKTVDGISYGYFAWLRASFKLLSFLPGVISASADEGTSQSLEVAEQFKNLTLSQLQNLKTPWGQVYLGYAMDVGTNFGVS